MCPRQMSLAAFSKMPRLTGLRQSASSTELEILEHLARDFSSPAIAKAFTRECQALQAKLSDSRELEAAKAVVAEISRRIRTLTSRLEETSEPAPILRRLEELEVERRGASERALRAEDNQSRIAALQNITEADVARLLAGISRGLAELHREALKDALRLWIDRIELDAQTRSGRLIYRLALTGDKLASPRVPNGKIVARVDAWLCAA